MATSGGSSRAGASRQPPAGSPVSRFPEQFDRSLFMLTSQADQLSADWMLIGGVSVSSWGRPRATTDIDFALSVSMDMATPVDRHMTGQGWEKVGGPAQIKDTGIYLAQYSKILGEGHVIGIDIFFTMTDWQRRALERRREVTFHERGYWTASPEDLILYKLIADRGLDQADVDNILDRRIDELDLPYVEAWSKTLGLYDRWADALSRFHDRRDMGI